MADAFTTNFISSSYSAIQYQHLSMLIAAGYVPKGSGDGLAAFSSTGNVFTGSGSGAGKTGNALGWMRLQDPAGITEEVHQWNNTGGLRIQYSPLAKFVGGSPSATQVPTATDSQFVTGAGTPASPLYNAFWLASCNNSTAKFQGGCRAASPYGWWLAGGTVGGSVCTMGLAYDPVSGDPSDTNQFVWIVDSVSNAAFSSATLNAVTTPSQNAVAVEGFIDVAKTIWTGFAANSYYCNAVVIGGAGGVGVNPFSGNYDLKPILYERNASSSGVTGQKGYSTNFRLTGAPQTNFTASGGGKTWICIGSLWAFWDGVTVASQ